MISSKIGNMSALASLRKEKNKSCSSYFRPGVGRMSISDVRGQGPGGHSRTLSQDRSLAEVTQRSRAKSRSLGLADIDPKFISQVRSLLFKSVLLDWFIFIMLNCP